MEEVMQLWDNPLYSRMPEPVGMVKVKDYEMPVVRIPEKILSPGLHGKNIEVYSLCAFVAPPGTGKRVPAEYMLDMAIETGLLLYGGEICEPTSGGTGVGLAYCVRRRNQKIIDKKKHYRVTALVSDDLPEGKLLPLLRQGATVIKESEMVKFLGLEKSPGDQELARLYAEKTGAVFLNQYLNPWNPEAWYKLVAPQVWKILQGRMTAAYFGLGSTGTLRGLGKYFWEMNPAVRLVGTRPYFSQVIDGTRTMGRLKKVAPWEEYLNYHEAVDFRVAEALSEELFGTAGIPGGKSSGAALGMLDHDYLGPAELGELAKTNVAFLPFLDTFVPYKQIG